MVLHLRGCGRVARCRVFSEARAPVGVRAFCFWGAMKADHLIQLARDWIKDDPDPATRAEAQELLDAGDLSKLKERFAVRLEFGTAGIRGPLGAGPGRMNRALVRKVTAGLASYLLRTVPTATRSGVVVGRDGRHMSLEFADDVVAVLTGAGIPVHEFPDVVPTPVCAYAVKELEAAAGIVITASHNPASDNGYKVFWSNGAQIIPPHDLGISKAVDAVPSIQNIPILERDEAAANGLCHTVPTAVGTRFLEKILEPLRHPETGRDLSLVYTPLHGVGGPWVKKAFSLAGFENFHVVPEQADPDPGFSTVRFPNPEEPGVLDLARDLAVQKNADLVLANDPDADRLAVMIKTTPGVYRVLTGNEIGLLLADYLLTEPSRTPVTKATVGSGVPQTAPDDPRIVMTTIVSSRLLKKMARGFGVHFRETLTGFKWIANMAIDLRETKGYTFVFGFEEALGYTIGETVRDKDGIGAALAFADLAAHCRSQNQTVMDRLETIYRRFGFHLSGQRGVILPGSSGMAARERIMHVLRSNLPTGIGGVAVNSISDFKTGIQTDLISGQQTRIDLPQSDVLGLELEDASRILVRPSGTEPKIKYYFEVSNSLGQEDTLAGCETAAQTRLRDLAKAFLDLVEDRLDQPDPEEGSG